LPIEARFIADLTVDCVKSEMGFNIIPKPGTRPVATPNAPFIADCVISEAFCNLTGSGEGLYGFGFLISFCF
jgi:hypothetical protein